MGLWERGETQGKTEERKGDDTLRKGSEKKGNIAKKTAKQRYCKKTE